MFRYPNRYLVEFEVPEPAAYVRWLNERGRLLGISSTNPPPFTHEGKDITPKTITRENYREIARKYYTVGISPPPDEKINIAVAVKRDAKDEFHLVYPPTYTVTTTEANIAVPDGYTAKGWGACVHAFGGVAQWWVSISVGGGKGKDSPISTNTLLWVVDNGELGDINSGNVPAAIQTVNASGFAATIHVSCTLSDFGLEKWKIATYEQILNAYWALKRQYDEEVAAKTISEGIQIAGDSPERNREIIREELKKYTVELLSGIDFRGRNLINRVYEEPPNDGTPPDECDTFAKKSKCPPEIDLDTEKFASYAAEIQFLEQAFEWENLTYVLYPYFWADSSQWQELARISGADPEFARFLRAGSARVVVPARPGFEHQVQLFVATGALWGG